MHDVFHPTTSHPTHQPPSYPIVRNLRFRALGLRVRRCRVTVLGCQVQGVGLEVSLGEVLRMLRRSRRHTTSICFHTETGANAEVCTDRQPDTSRTTHAPMHSPTPPHSHAGLYSTLLTRPHATSSKLLPSSPTPLLACPRSEESPRGSWLSYSRQRHNSRCY